MIRSSGHVLDAVLGTVPFESVRMELRTVIGDNQFWDAILQHLPK